MNYSLDTKNTRTTLDRLLDRELSIVKLLAKMDAPYWYWFPYEWEMMEYQLDKELAARDRRCREYLDSDYPSCKVL